MCELVQDRIAAVDEEIELLKPEVRAFVHEQISVVDCMAELLPLSSADKGFRTWESLGRKVLRCKCVCLAVLVLRIDRLKLLFRPRTLMHEERARNSLDCRNMGH